jgi:cation transport protein ChaC
VQGWHRSFCIRTLLGRGSQQAPGAMLGLDRGGACRGVLYRIEAAKVRTELQLLWRREMFAGTYDAHWVPAQNGAGALRALTFVVNRQHERYIGGHPIPDIAQLIRTGKGVIGSSRAYFDATVRTLERLGIRDAGMERLQAAILLGESAAT